MRWGKIVSTSYYGVDVENTSRIISAWILLATSSEIRLMDFLL